MKIKCLLISLMIWTYLPIASAQQCYSHSKDTDFYDGYSISFKQPCNTWEVQVNNDSNNKLRCFFNGKKFFVAPLEVTAWKEIGDYISIEGACEIYSEALKIGQASKTFVVETKTERSFKYIRIRNKLDRPRRCTLFVTLNEGDPEEEHWSQTLQPNEAMDWERANTISSYLCKDI